MEGDKFSRREILGTLTVGGLVIAGDRASSAYDTYSKAVEIKGQIDSKGVLFENEADYLKGQLKGKNYELKKDTAHGVVGITGAAVSYLLGKYLDRRSRISANKIF